MLVRTPSGARTYYLGRPAGRRSCGEAGPPVSGQRAPAIADHVPLTEAAVNAMRLGVHEREHGGCESVLGLPELFPVPGPKACVRAGGRLAFELLRAQNLHRPREAAVPRAGHQVW